MDRNSDGTVDGFSGTELPGSGDDSRHADVEGHRNLNKAIDDEIGPDGQHRLVKYTDDADVEGHRNLNKAIDDEIGPDGQHRLVKYTDDADVEGHLFHSGPTTQGEFMKSGPGDNPHGER